MVETRRKSNAPTRGVSPVAGKSLPSRSRSKTPIKSAVAFTTEKVSIADLKTDEKSSKKHVEYEFGGPVGAFFVVVGLPLVIYALYFFCNKDICLQSPLNFPWKRFIETLPKQASELFSWEALHIYGFWICFQLLLERFLPGEVVEGATLPNGSRLKYTMSGHLQFWISLVLMGHAVPRLIKDPQSGVWSLAGLSPLPLHLLYDHYVPLITVSCLGALALSVYLYATSFFPGRILASGGNTGSPVYDFFIGRELNPRVGSLDLKEFCELRPGLIGWAVLNLGMAVKQYRTRALHSATGRTGSISMSMLLIVLTQGLYVFDALYQEMAILSTMDITTDGFGYMLAFGDLAWVPFVYSLQARYLVDHDPQLTLPHIALALLALALGFYIFRSANSEKDAFRKDPNAPHVAHLKYLQTKRGTRLITSGWWGAARKINYTGDWLITLSWCLLCGYDSPIPYFQAVYFLVLLVHRAQRDDQMCAEKYGDDWAEYKRRVPFLFIPYVV